jgi:hypothetical protein
VSCRYVAHALNPMKSLEEEPRCFEFAFPRMDTLLRVEESDGNVIIRASRDSFSTRRKISFIRELVAEGFIPDDYKWHLLADPDSPSRGVQWRVDHSWLRLDEAAMARTRRSMMKLLASAILLLVAEMTLASAGFLDGAAQRTVNAASAEVRGSHWQR